MHVQRRSASMIRSPHLISYHAYKGIIKKNTITIIYYCKPESCSCKFGSSTKLYKKMLTIIFYRKQRK